MIQAKVRQPALMGILGSHGEVNLQGEVQQKLDVFANESLLHCLASRPSIGILASEENEHPMIVPHNSAKARLCRDFRSARWFVEYRFGL